MPMWLFYVNASGLLEEPEVLQTQDNDSMDKMADIKFKWRKTEERDGGMRQELMNEKRKDERK